MGIDRFGCNDCQLYFKNIKLLEKHIHIHKLHKRNMCHVCNNNFLNQNELKDHLKTHVEPGSVICTLCNASFTTEGLLNVKTFIFLILNYQIIFSF